MKDKILNHQGFTFNRNVQQAGPLWAEGSSGVRKQTCSRNAPGRGTAEKGTDTTAWDQAQGNGSDFSLRNP